jgi:hypothetical protein
MKRIMGYTQTEAIEYILSCGWLPHYPVENVPLTSNYFWDGKNYTVAHAWGSALVEIARRKDGIQLPLFETE